MLVPTTGPMLCRDEMEDWSASEANLFEEAIEKYGKDFNDIRKDFLPWKSMKNIIEYFFMWKTTDRYEKIWLKISPLDGNVLLLFFLAQVVPSIKGFS